VAGAGGANDRESADIGSAQILSNEALNTEKQIVLTPAMIEELIDGTFTNNGFIIIADTELNDGFTYKSSDHATASQRPKLVIQYTLPSGGVSPREGASRFLSNNSKPFQQSGFPTTSVLDNFNRANGAIGSNWIGQNDSSFTVSSNQLAINSSGLDSFVAWSLASFGADQEAYVTLSQLSASGTEQGLLLKTAADASAALKVVYAASANVVRVFTYTSATGWVQRGSDISVTMNNGDQLGARAKANGHVEVYRNGSLLGTVSVTAWAPYSGGGYIGLWYSNVSGAIVDDFGGGNVSSSPTATPTTTLTPTTTNTPTITSTASPTGTMSNTPTITNTATITDTPAITLTPSNTSMPSHTPTVTFTPSQTFTPSFTPTLTNIPTFTSTPGQPPSGPVTITYEYDPLYRLTEANYSTGDYYHYTYDAVGNRLSQTTQLAVTSYQYDDANRLTSVDGVNYTWDNNGNLLNDGVNTYAYDSANRLTSFNGTSSYAYNGMGDRLSQTVNGNTTNYTLDLNSGLTQVLSDGQFTYLYGLDNIAQVNAGGTQYFLGDALNSTRQLTDASGQVTRANAYEPYGNLAQTAGSAQTSYGFTGEWTDPSGMVYLRARYYSSGDGRFLTRDTWMGDYNRPLSLNRWGYVEGNPVNLTDPSGFGPCDKFPPGERDLCEMDAPNVKNYNEMIPPHNITWISNSIANNINRHLVPIYDVAGNFISKTNAAQFQIAGHRNYTDGTCLPGYYDKKTGTCSRYKSYNVNFCGQVVLAAVLRELIPSVTAKIVADALNYQSGTAASDLGTYLNQNYPNNVNAQPASMANFVKNGQVFFDHMSQMFTDSTLVMPVVNIMFGNSGADTDGINGQLGLGGNSIGHWILITGISREWERTNDRSVYNWVRIFNPFDNQAEYYWWPDFYASWREESPNNFTALKIRIK